MQVISGFTERRDCVENREKNLQGGGGESHGDGVKTNTKPYKGYYVTSFKLSQLGDAECTGTSYSVYKDEAAYRSGQEPLSARECLFTFADVKQFIAGGAK